MWLLLKGREYERDSRETAVKEEGDTHEQSQFNSKYYQTLILFLFQQAILLTEAGMISALRFGMWGRQSM